MLKNHSEAIEIMVIRVKELENEKCTYDKSISSYVDSMKKAQDERDEISVKIECLKRSILDLKGLDNIRASNEKIKKEA